jgi:hypothetical protein
MTEQAASEAATSHRLPMRPTPALIRAGVVSLFAAALALLFGRIDLLVPGLPLLCWAVLARMRRADRGADRGVPEPRLLASNTQIAEGDTVRLAVEGGVDGIEGDTAAASAASVAGDPDQFVTVTCPLPAHADMTPVWGAITDTSRAHLDATVHRWGRYHVGPLHVVLADPFGAHRAETQVDPVHLRVTPDASLLDAPLDIPSPIGVAGLHLSRRRGDGTALADVRPFQLGDRLHRINWPVTSRTGHLHTNATFTEQDTDVLLVTDTLLDVVPPEGPSSLDMTVRATTAVTRYYLGIGDRVGVHDLGGAIGPIRTGAPPAPDRHRVPLPCPAGHGRARTRATRRRRAFLHPGRGLLAAAGRWGGRADRPARGPWGRCDRRGHLAGSGRGRGNPRFPGPRRLRRHHAVLVRGVGRAPTPARLDHS